MLINLMSEWNDNEDDRDSDDHSSPSITDCSTVFGGRRNDGCNKHSGSSESIATDMSQSACHIKIDISVPGGDISTLNFINSWRGISIQWSYEI